MIFRLPSFHTDLKIILFSLKNEKYFIPGTKNRNCIIESITDLKEKNKLLVINMYPSALYTILILFLIYYIDINCRCISRTGYNNIIN